jgi:hypothetical protein
MASGRWARRGYSIAWAVEVFIQASTLRREQDHREWIGELVGIVNNVEGKRGRWLQVAAWELHGLKRRKRIVLRIARLAHAHWKANDGSETILTELDDLIRKMGG